MSPERRATGLNLREIRIRLDGELLVSLDAEIAPGETLTVMGPSGIGKSTLLAFVAGFLGRDFSAEGRILLNGSDVTDLPPERRGIGLLFQDALLLPHLSVAGNLLIGAGRWPTVTTETVALASGGDRKLIGATALLQALLPFLGFAVAALVPAILFRNRRLLRASA